MKFKSNKAITLVALIITIIILLILAGVSLSMVLGENGLINKVQSSVNKYQESYVNEQNLLNKVEEYFDLLNRKDGEIELSATSGECTYPNTITFDVIKNASGGELSVKTSSEDIATATISGNTITVTPKNVDETTTITVTSAGTKEYKEKSVEYTLKVKKQKVYSNGETVSLGGYEFYVIGDDGTNVTLLCKTSIGEADWYSAKSQASTFGSNLGGSGRLLTKAEAGGVAANYRANNTDYWLLDTNKHYGGDLYASLVLSDGTIYEICINRAKKDSDNTVHPGPTNWTSGVRPVVVISKSKL